MQRLHHTRSLCPARACARSQRHNRQLTLRQRLPAGFIQLRSREPRIRSFRGEIDNVRRRHVANVGIRAQPILRQTDPIRAKVSPNLLVLRAIKAIGVKQFIEGGACG